MPRSRSVERTFYPSIASVEREGSPFARLAVLHEENVETIRLAALLGRTPMAACALILGCFLQLVLFGMLVPLVTVGVWGVLVLAGAFGLLRLVSQSERSSYELAPLRAFSLDLNAMLLYAGFAWGSGGFLAVPLHAGATTLLCFALGPSLVITAIVQLRTPVLCFLVPNIALGIAAALAGPAGIPAAMVIFVLGGMLGGSTAWAERRQSRRTSIPLLPASMHS